MARVTQEEERPWLSVVRVGSFIEFFFSFSFFRKPNREEKERLVPVFGNLLSPSRFLQSSSSFFFIILIV